MAKELGQKLRNARELKKISPELVAQKLNIRLEYLLAIEDGNWHKLPPGLYAKNYIKKYSHLMKIPYSEIKQKLNNNLETINTNNDPFSKKVLRKKELLLFPKLIKNIVLLIIFLACFLYIALYFKKIILAPQLDIYQPAKNLKTNENFIEIKGKTEAEAEISINGEDILSNSDGYFSTNIKLKRGVNNILIKSKKKYSGEASILRQILVE